MIDSELGSVLIYGGRIIDPGQDIDQVGDLVINKGRVVQVGRGTAVASCEKGKDCLAINATGLIVCPGLIDLHCHLREPGFEDKETIATGTRAAATGGFTTVCCMANTDPPLDSRIAVDWVKQKASIDASVHVLPIGCISRGRRGEEICDMLELAKAGVVGFSDDGNPVADSQLMRRAMECARDLGLPIIDHCEDRALSSGGVINEGRVSAELGLKGIPAAAEEIMVARDLILAKLTGGRVHIAHVSTCGSVELIRCAKEKGISVTAEVTPHHLTLTEEIFVGRRYDTSAKVNPPLRSEEDIACLVKGLKDGVIDAIATDHAPHALADKNCDIALAAFGISGLETALGCLMSLVHKGEVGLTTLLSKLTCEPARVIGREGDLGNLKPGVPANITLFDPDREWIVDSQNFLSKGKNTPFDGCKFKGKVMATIVDGRIAYIDSSLKSHSPQTYSTLTGHD